MRARPGCRKSDHPLHRLVTAPARPACLQTGPSARRESTGGTALGFDRSPAACTVCLIQESTGAPSHPLTVADLLLSTLYVDPRGQGFRPPLFSTALAAREERIYRGPHGVTSQLRGLHRTLIRGRRRSQSLGLVPEGLAADYGMSLRLILARGPPVNFKSKKEGRKQKPTHRG